MPRNANELKGVEKLGSGKTVYSDTYNPALLESFSNKHPANDYWVTLNCPEFTSLCPVTGQPDFANIIIQYIPDKKLVESKSLKLYLFSYRNYGEFHEDCVNRIMNDLFGLLNPKYIEVLGRFLPRGGISIDPFVCKGRGKYAKLAEMRFANHNMSPSSVDNR